MCAIIDANIVSEVFGDRRPAAGEAFFKWIDSGKGVVVVGGRLNLELLRASARFGKWAQVASLSGRLFREDSKQVDAVERQITQRRQHLSDDPHVLALAQVSGARLLYTNDRDLQRDFRDPTLISQPRGNIYTTLVNKHFAESHKSLLNRRDLCSA